MMRKTLMMTKKKMVGVCVCACVCVCVCVCVCMWCVLCKEGGGGCCVLRKGPPKVPEMSGRYTKNCHGQEVVHTTVHL